MKLASIKENKFLKFFDTIKSDSLGFYFSFFLHSFILIFSIGLPIFFDSKPLNIPIIIPIEIINVSDVTSIPDKVKDTKISESKKIQIKEKKFNSSENQEIKKINVKDKVKIKESEVKEIFVKEKVVIEEKKNIPMDIKKQKVPLKTNIVESLPTKLLKPKLKPTQSSKAEESKKDIVIKTKANMSIKKESSIASLLKDLRNEKSVKSSVKTEDKEIKSLQKNDTTEEKEIENTKLSINETDLVLQQLRKCFNPPAGAVINEDEVVKLSSKLRQNGQVIKDSIRIIDTNISKSSTFYKPITESAMRTLLHPECTTLKLPKEKYNAWKNLIITFDYSWITK